MVMTGPIWPVLFLCTSAGIFLLARACLPDQVFTCQSKIMKKAREIKFVDEKKDSCVVLDYMKTCLTKEAKCNEVGVAQGLEVIKTHLESSYGDECAAKNKTNKEHKDHKHNGNKGKKGNAAGDVSLAAPLLCLVPIALLLTSWK